MPENTFTSTMSDKEKSCIDQTCELRQYLGTLSKAIHIVDMDDAVRNDYLREIITINAQLSEKKPNKNIIKRAWCVLEKLTKVETLCELIEKIRDSIGRLINQADFKP